MTLRDSELRSDTDLSSTGSQADHSVESHQSNYRSKGRRLNQRLRRQRRRKDRRLLSETLEQRQLLAGPDLIGIQPDGDALLNPERVLNVSPRELIFRFDDNANLDPTTLNAIQITRAGEDGIFESALATSDLGTDGQALVEFRARQSGILGNGLEIRFTSSARAVTVLPILSVTDKLITVDLNRAAGQGETIGDIIAAINGDAAASSLVEAISVSGSTLTQIVRLPGGNGFQTDNVSLTLIGANSAEAITDFGTNGAVRVRFVSAIPGAEGKNTQISLERRNFGGPANPVVIINDQSVRIQLNSSPGFESTAGDLINAINTNPEASALLIAALQEGDLNTRIGVDNGALPDLALTGVSDVVLEPGFIGLGNSSHEVVFRFAEPLPDDLYQISILGAGNIALRNADGERFFEGENYSSQFIVDLGPQVVAVVPEPVRRAANGSLSPEIGKIEVHFNEDLDISLAQNPSYYQLVFTRDTARNTDDVVVIPQSVSYNSITNIATLDFGRPLSRISASPGGNFLTGAARLRVGASEGLPSPPTEITLTLNPSTVVEPGDSFDSAFDLNSQWTVSPTATTSARLSSEIFNTQPYGLDLPGPNLPGTRTIRPDDPSRLSRTVPLDYLRNGADVVDGISVIQYNFAPTWLGDDPGSPGIAEDKTYTNIISEQQKQRVREVMQLYSEYLGISFVEVEGEATRDAFISIAVGDLYGGDARATSSQGGLAVVTRDRNGDGIADLGVLDFQDFDESIDDHFGGEFFRGSMFVVGQLLGYGYADDLPQPVTQSSSFIFTPSTDNEPAFPSVADIVHGQYLYRPDSTDIDLYRFGLSTAGKLSVETFAERLSSPSLLDTSLKLYRLGSSGAFEEIAANEDYFSNDSLIDIELDAGTYMIGVSSRGNTNYDPGIETSGFGGLTEGEYELVIDFKPSTTNALTDAPRSYSLENLDGEPITVTTNPTALDGDGDNHPGGVFNFWFVPSDSNNTLYVDKVAPPTSGPVGSVGNPFREIDRAILAARPGDTIRVIGNGGADGRVETRQDNISYQIGFSSNGLPLSDGSSLELPQGVRMVIDSGAILKFNGSRIGVGSVSPQIDLSNSSLQVLGTPSIIGANGLPVRDATGTVIPGSVVLTSLDDNTVGLGGASPTSANPQPGDWGGIDFRGDIDSSDESRLNLENEGIFLNHVQLADIRYGGGAVSIGGRQVVVSPIDMAVTRATVINSRITRSADAAIAATPETFIENRFTDEFYQAAGSFTPDYDRVGPNISGNTIIDNSINGLFIRIVTRTGSVLQTINSATRFDDTDITHILTENLVINGTAGGAILQSSAPSSLLVRLGVSNTGNIPAGRYVYKITNVDSLGLESAPSQSTLRVELTQAGGVVLTQLPTVGVNSSFVSRRLYRASIDPGSGLPNEFRLVAQLNAGNTAFTDTQATGTTLLSNDTVVLRSRLDGRLAIDPGTVVKLDGARIEARFGADLIAEGIPSVPVVFTSLEDKRYGAGGTFDTNDRGSAAEINPGDWGGIFIGQTADASIDYAVIAGAGGITRVEGGFASFNAIEVHQASLRLTNSIIELNADGRERLFGDRVGRGDNASGSVFVRASAPILAGNTITGGTGAAFSFDVNSLSSLEVNDPGRSTALPRNIRERGIESRLDVVGNSGPLIEGNILENNGINAVQIRGGQLSTAGVWDDVDIVHVVTESIEIPNQHIFGGLRLQSDARGSLVVKFESAENETAGIVVGGSLLTSANELRDIRDRIGGSLQIIGHPDFPVVLTTLADDTAGAGFTVDGLPQLDTNNDGIAIVDLAESIGPTLPTGPEVNNGTLIDNDVDPATPGFFSYQPLAGGALQQARTTTQGLTQIFPNQSPLFDYGFFVDVDADGTGIGLETTTITQQPTLISDDRVQSAGTFTGANGVISWVIEQFYLDGRPDLISEITFTSDQALGDLRFINYYDPIIGTDSGDNLFTEGTPGANDFRLTILDAPEEIGFRQYGTFEPGPDLVNATYEGWIADLFPNLAPNFNLAFNPAGTIANIPVQNLPQFPQPNYGPGIITSALAWVVDPTATTASFRTNLEVIAEIFGSDPTRTVDAGLWNGVVIREGASDRNVAAFAEQEPSGSGFFDSNSIPSRSQFLGEIAPDLQSGDENRRLGFVVEGAITARDDLDVFSFFGQSATEVWLDIDRAANSLDSVVELINANGVVLASSNDSLVAETDPNGLYVAPGVNPDAAQSLSVVEERITSQEITISESIVDASGGEITLNVPGGAPIQVSVAAFKQDPAGAIGNALQTNFGDRLGTVTASLNRRAERQFDPANPSVITRFGGDFVIQLRFDPSFFVGRTVPDVLVSTVGVTGPTTVTSSVTKSLFGSQLQDAYSSNPKDAGMRIRLPGEPGTRNLYHVRVRSSNTLSPTDFTTLVDPSLVREGISRGQYQLQIRLTEQDEHPGTQLRQADVRYAQNGLQIIGQPLHSPLLGEDREIPGDLAIPTDPNNPTADDPNNSLAEAQPLGFFGTANDATSTDVSPLSSDRLAKSFAGTLSSALDVDWYTFTVNYENLTRDAANLYLSTVFDLDYASGFARADMALYVFDANGQLILIGGDSNIADDLPGLASGSVSQDLSRGSAAAEDPYIGTAELSEGVYYVAVSNQQNVPLPLDQFFNANSTNPLLRLEPIDSVRRIAHDRIGAQGGATADDPELPILFDDDSFVANTLDDMLIYVNTGTNLQLANAFTGQRFGSLGDFGGGEVLQEVAFANNGELFSYNIPQGALTDTSLLYYQIDTGNAALSAPLSAGASVTTFESDIVVTQNAPDIYVPIVANSGLDVQGIDIGALGGTETGFLVANRAAFSGVAVAAGAEYSQNILYRFNPSDGSAAGPGVQFPSATIGLALSGAATSPREVGQITDGIRDVGPGTISTVLGLQNAVETNSNGIQVAGLADGDTFTLDTGAGTVTFEFDAGITLSATNGVSVLDGQTVTIDSNIFEFDQGSGLLMGDNATGQIDGTRVRLQLPDNSEFLFEFVGDNSPTPGTFSVASRSGGGIPLTSGQLAANLAASIQLTVPGIQAASSGSSIVFTGPTLPTLTVFGSVAQVTGGNGVGAGNISIDIRDTTSPTVVIERLAAALRATGINVDSNGPILSLPDAINVSYDVSGGGQYPATSARGINIGGGNGVTDGNTAIPFLVSDSAGDIALRIASTINSIQAGVLADVSASPAGRSVTFTNTNVSDVQSANNSLLRGGLRLGGQVTGVAAVDEGSALYAVTENGALFRIAQGTALSNGARTDIGIPVFTATDLIDVPFTALRSGPSSFNNGELRSTLFGITANGDIYAFNTRGELQPVFSGGRSILRTGITGARGFDFSTLGFNLWHRTGRRNGDAGHGLDAIFNGTRQAQLGGVSLAFNYEQGFNARFAQGEGPVSGTPPNISNPRLDGQNVDATYNFPGGAKGAVQSNSFDLEGFAKSDEPYLYFTYFLDTDQVDSATPFPPNGSGDRDSLRVYITTDSGVQHLVASNNIARLPGLSDDEFDDPAATGQYDDSIDVEVQQLFDNTGTWRQARIPLREFAGESDLSLRIEFSSGGSFNTGSPTIATVAGSSLQDGDRLVVSGQTFTIDLVPAVNTPGGAQLATLYQDPNALATLTIDGQTYAFDDGTRTIPPNAIPVSLSARITSRGSLGNISPADIATELANTVRSSPPPNPIVGGLVITDPQDVDPTSTDTGNDTLPTAFSLPYAGGNITFEADGQIGYDQNQGNFTNLATTAINPGNVDDVDLIRVNLQAGAVVDVSVAALADGTKPVLAVVRFFDKQGIEVNPIGSGNNVGTFVAPSDDIYYIGISGSPNGNYDPRFEDSGITADIGAYRATIAINTSVQALRVQSSGNLVELLGSELITASPSNLFPISGTGDPVGISVPISRLMSADQVAGVLQETLADRFTGGDPDLLITTSNLVRIPGFTIDDAGPFADTSARYGEQFGAGPIGAARGNDFEGVFLDDFIIGFAERGEIATNSAAVTTDFVTDLRPQFPVPPDPVSSLVTGAYQVEIRDGSEYVDSVLNQPFRSFDTNTRLNDSRFIEALAADQLRDGATFSMFDGRSTIEFEFDLIESGNGVVPGRVGIPYTLIAVEPGSEDIDPNTGLPIPGTGTIRPQTASEVAVSIVAAINRTDVRSVMDVSAILDSGVDAKNSSRVVLSGDVVINNDDQALALVGRDDLRGDDNRQRETQGVILIENSRFLFNSDYGIAIDHGLIANVAGQDTPSVVRYPRNLVELNTENITSGVVIQSNVIAFNGTGGLRIEGIAAGTNQTQGDPIAFDRIINNTIIGGTITAGPQSPPQTFSGVLFNQGAISFADQVVDYSPNAGGSPPTLVFQTPDSALGAPNDPDPGAEPIDGVATVSLGQRGSITVQFIDNLLTASGDGQPDLIVFESGEIESVSVEVSRDGVQFVNVGTVGGLLNTVDLDQFGFNAQDRFAFVRLTDNRQGDVNSPSLGADIDAIGALSSVSVESFDAGGNGIDLIGAVAPVLLNNVIANSETGILADDQSDLRILGGNTFYRNTTDVPSGISVGEFPQQLSAAEVIFVGASDLVFAPSAGASIIDSSIDSLEDRASLTTVKNPLGLPPSPILAPRLDVNGQVRIDDPNVETPGGLGERVFKDRGASDRGDLVGPRVILRSPQAPRLGIDAGQVSVLGRAPKFFEVQLIDGLAPADVTPGTGIDDRSVSSGSVLLLKDNKPLVEGVDYRFGYNPSTNVIRLTPIAGVWEENSTYVIRMIDSSDAIVQASDGNTYLDGGVLNIRDLDGGTTQFEYELGITMRISPGTLASGNADGIELVVFDGVNTVTFELDNDNATNPLNTAVVIPAAGNDSLIADALVSAINASNLSLIAVNNGTMIQLNGNNPLSSITPSTFFPTQGRIGTGIGFGIQIPTLDGQLLPNFADGDTFELRRGATTLRTFEFDNDGVLGTTGSIAIPFNQSTTLDQLANEMVRVIAGSQLGLSPVNLGFGRIALGGDATYSINVSNSSLTSLGIPGQIATTPIPVSVTQTGVQVAETIAAIINGSGINGLSANTVDTRVFLEGSLGVNGIGAIDTVTIQDEVGNLLQSNQSNGRTELTIFVGGGFDYGDTPESYHPRLIDGGPRHAIDTEFVLGSTITADSDAKTDNSDTDDGVTIGSLQAGFRSNITVTVSNASTQPFYLDAWFDWNNNQIFELDEVQRFGTVGTNLAVISAGANSILVNVPGDAVPGETYARFRLSREANLGPGGETGAGEVEDYQIIVSNNPFQNPNIDTTNNPAHDLRKDVNDSGFVSPLDALQIINVLRRNGGNVDLSAAPLPNSLPTFPDVNADGFVSALDALQVINTLALLPDSNGGEGEWIRVANATGYQSVASGVLASGATRLGDAIADPRDETVVHADIPVGSSAEKTSVFDSPESIQLDSIVDLLAEDATETSADSSDSENIRDAVFASLPHHSV